MSALYRLKNFHLIQKLHIANAVFGLLTLILLIATARLIKVFISNGSASAGFGKFLESTLCMRRSIFNCKDIRQLQSLFIPSNLCLHANSSYLLVHLQHYTSCRPKSSVCRLETVKNFDRQHDLFCLYAVSGGSAACSSWCGRYSHSWLCIVVHLGRLYVLENYLQRPRPVSLGNNYGYRLPVSSSSRRIHLDPHDFLGAPRDKLHSRR